MTQPNLPKTLDGYTLDEIDWATECMREEWTGVIALLIELRRTTLRQNVEREARDLVALEVNKSRELRAQWHGEPPKNFGGVS